MFKIPAGWRVLFFLSIIAVCDASRIALADSSPEFEISFPYSTQHGPITGRLLLLLSRTNDPEVRYQVGWVNSPPTFGIDVLNFAAGQTAVIDGNVAGFPLRSLKELPPGEYYVQALLNVYTKFSRADGHVIWAHMDHWEGQQFNRSPGNLFSKPQRIRLDESRQLRVKVSLTEVVPAIQRPADTEWVKYIKIRSKLLTRFWGRPMYLGAVVVLPRGYDDHPDTSYPVIYYQGHFTLDAPFSFRTSNTPETDDERKTREDRGSETGYAFYRSWISDDFPRVIAVSFLHPTPYFDDSYAVDSANNGPYGTAIMTELIPYIEKRFRIITSSYARLLTGGSTGGWEALALQLLHPEFFGGTWTFYPDPVDFRRFELVDIYRDENLFVVDPRDVPQWGRQEWVPSERAFVRAVDGQTITTMRQESQLEAVLGSKGRSGGTLAAWEAVFGPVGEDGYPKPLFNEVTGSIDHNVASYMRNHGYDLRHYAETNWPRIGAQISGKLKFYCGDMDNFYLNLGVRLFGQFLEKFDGSYTRTTLEYGPMKGHGWQPMTNAALVRLMADRVASQSPIGTSLAWTAQKQ
jgi:Putative esterase